MGAHIEWTQGILRLGSKLEKYGDDYEFACQVMRDGDTVIFKGANSECQMNLVQEREAIREQLKPIGVKKVRWIRIKDGKEIPFEREI